VKLTLHGYWRSSASWRVRIALGLKELDYTYVPVDLTRDGGEQHQEAYRARNPMRQVPILSVEEPRREPSGALTTQAFELTQSVAIFEWLEERCPTPSLLPSDLLLRARTRQLVEIANSGIQPLHNLAVLQAVKAWGGDEKAWAKSVIERGLEAFSSVTAQVSGRFCVGDAPTFADACLIPQLYAARRFGADLGPHAGLLAIEAACATLPAFERAHADRQSDARPA
jgi:maleylpyruvate isomerase